MGAWFSSVGLVWFGSVWFGLVWLKNYALGNILEKRQTRRQRTLKSEKMVLTVRKEMEKTLNILYIFPGHLLMQALSSRP